MAAERLPLTLLTGFLGSGKTTLLQQLLRRPELADSLVIVNELGAVGLDHQLLARAVEELPVVELPSGCMCCSLRTDLSRTLREVTWRFSRQGQRLFQRVYVETTGMADPAPILRTLLTEPDLRARYRLDAVLVTVDAATAMQSLDRQEEAVKQVAAADLLLLTKADLVDPETLVSLRARLSTINPAAPQEVVDHGRIDPARLRGISAERDLRAWLGEGQAHDHAHHADVVAHCLLVEEPIDPGAVEAWLDLLLSLHGPRVLRLKALLHLVGDPRPWVLHGVQHLVHPPRPLPAWPDADRRSRIVLISRGVPGEAVEGSFRAMVGQPTKPVPSR